MQFLKQWIKYAFGPRLYKKQLSATAAQALADHRLQWSGKTARPLHEAALDIFTYHGEDGIINYLVEKCTGIPRRFADIGSGDCIKSNCAALAVHGNWEGLFIDQDNRQLNIGRRFYNPLNREGRNLRFCEAAVTPGNINELLAANGCENEIGLLSIDIDGNDYWIWEAISVVQPAIVVIEAKVEFGTGDYLVSYGPANHRAADPQYNGASVSVLCRLAAQKGYKLAGANKQGYNLFFVREAVNVPEVNAADVLRDPETIRSFYPEEFFSSHKFEQR